MYCNYYDNNIIIGDITILYVLYASLKYMVFATKLTTTKYTCGKTAPMFQK
jgi:hypothetical protein